MNDLKYLIKMKYYKANKGFKYILACIDIFTRKLYCIPMKSKENDEVKQFERTQKCNVSEL